MNEPNTVAPEVVNVQHFSLDDIGYTLLRHTEREKEMQNKVDKLYSVVVTGNGVPPLLETVRQHERWISTANRFLWVIVSAVIVQVVTTTCAILPLIYLALTNITADSP